MKIKELLKNINILNNIEEIMEQDVEDIVFDSRKVSDNCVFVCVKGEKSDGHLFAKMAEEKGAKFILSEKETDSSLPHILVENSRRALSIMCANFNGNPQEKLKFIGITGTNGKTTITYIIKSMLENLGKKVGLIGTIQNMIGDEILPSGYSTPEPYELFGLLKKMVEEKVDFVVMEVTSHALCQDRVYNIPYEVGVFTNLTQDHLDFHKTMENYLEAKTRLFKVCKKGVINIDDEASEYIIQNATCEINTYSAKYDRGQLVAKNIEYYPDKVKFVAVMQGQIGRARFETPGEFSVSNALASIGALISLGFSLEEALEGLNTAKGVKGRAEVVPTGKNFTVIIDYAHTPDGLEKIITSVSNVSEGRIVTLFGCGGDRDATKRPIMGEIAEKYSDFVIVTSDNPRTEDPEKIVSDILKGIKGKNNVKVIVDRKEAIRYALENAREKDIIILAGKGHETYQITNEGKIHFDEREIIKEILE
ncbi:MAG: UDP-N-acetylmuramoyl-L-alanyl-D-glutamate--2,6-diaminopimelate ligase [Clostridia bacterium]|nr:UDP-N-acetylmuramoyl-L-alanyl-D-glutamate--2,6-diaminopimelate ligase [Clostridia bacterium]